jgi:hypothetical protein
VCDATFGVVRAIADGMMHESSAAGDSVWLQRSVLLAASRIFLLGEWMEVLR